MGTAPTSGPEATSSQGIDPSHIASEFERAIDEEPDVFLDDDERYDLEERVDPQTGWLE